MDVVKAIVVFGLFFLGLVLAFQGIVGKEIDLAWLRMPIDLEHPGMEHPNGTGWCWAADGRRHASGSSSCSARRVARRDGGSSVHAPRVTGVARHT